MPPTQQNPSVSEISARIREEGLSWEARDTKLSALAPSEQKKYLGLKLTAAQIRRMAAAVQTEAAEEMRAFKVRAQVAAPVAFDWRNVGGKNYVTPVKDQGPCGSCVSFGSCAVIEANKRIKSQNHNLDVDLSEAFLQFCGGGSCAGWGLTSGLIYAKSTGVTDEACFPYQPQNLPCANRCSDWQSRLQKILSYKGHSSMEARKNAISTIGPVLAGMAVYSDFFSYSTGVYQKTSGSSLVGKHCICVVGYDDNQQCWILKNSWGTGWGDNGYCRVRYGQADLLIDSSLAFCSVDVLGESEVLCPDAVGMPWHKAVQEVHDASLTVANESQLPKAVLHRRIKDQSPAAGEKLLVDSTVTLYVTCPNVVGRQLPAAEHPLARAGLIKGTVTKTPASGRQILKTKVTKQDPAAKSSVPIGSKVHLWVSTRRKAARVSTSRRAARPAVRQRRRRRR